MLKSLFRLVLGGREPIVDGTLRTRAVRGEVLVRRDANGIPYVQAEHDEDAFYGVGFCQGQDRAIQLELLQRAARGTLAAWIGKDMLAADQLARRVGFARIAQAQLAVQSEGTRTMLEAYARGVTEGRRIGLPKKPHEHVLLGGAPSDFEASDVLAILQFIAFALSSNWDAELARMRVLHDDGPDALRDLEAADPSWLKVGSSDRLAQDLEAIRAAEALAAPLAAMSSLTGTSAGSNAWALAASRTATKRPLLVADPHLAPTLPAPWYLAHVRTPRWALSGAFFVSQPVPSIGHNERVAWALTAGHVDNTDLFVEHLGPDGRSVRVGDRWAPCEVREERIEVRGRAALVERVLVTRHGPIVSPALDGGAVALSMRGTWMAARPIGVYDAYRARSVEEMRSAFASYPATSENRVFADVDGRIAWQVVGDAPRRKKGNGVVPMCGWDPEVGWEDAPLPFDALPGERDPERGFVASANERPPLRADAPFLGADWLDGYRHDRIVQRLAERSDWTLELAQAMQLDRTSAMGLELKTALVDVLATTNDPRARRARALLETWDGVASPESVGATVFELLVATMACMIIERRAPKASAWALGMGTNAILMRGMMPLRRLTQLSRLLREQPAGWFGKQSWTSVIEREAASVIATLERKSKNESDWAWGRVRPLVLRHPVGAQPPLGRIFDIGPIAFGGDGSSIQQASLDFRDPLGAPTGMPNLRLAIDVGAWENSRWALAGGQSGNPCSRHYADLVSPWERGRGVTMAWSAESVKAAAVSTLTISPS